MTVYTYTGKLADFSDAPFPEAQPRLWVEGRHASTSPRVLHALKRVRVPVNSRGFFSVDLVASTDLSPASDYVLRCEWLDADTVIGWTEWEFTALIGGGNIADMPTGEITNVWYSTMPPPVDRTGIIWIHPETGDVREWV